MTKTETNATTWKKFFFLIVTLNSFQGLSVLCWQHNTTTATSDSPVLQPHGTGFCGIKEFNKFAMTACKQKI
jgi:hypothetical protein